MLVKRINFKKAFYTLAVSASVLTLSSCGPDIDEEPKPAEQEGPGTPPVVKFAGELFSVPSPIQTAQLIKQSGSAFNAGLLNDPKNVTKYESSYLKALNLGIYGADLGYVTLYDQTQESIRFMQAVKKLGDELNITGAFDAALVSRFTNNIANKDSLLQLVGVAYRSSDAYLKTNEREDISSLVLAGGWIETLYLATNVAKTKNNPDIIRRIAEQKSSINSLIKLLTKYNSQAEVTEIIDQLKDLNSIFDNVEFKYSYEKPTVNADKKLTMINSKTEVKITPQQIDGISQKIGALRGKISGTNS